MHVVHVVHVVHAVHVAHVVHVVNVVHAVHVVHGRACLCVRVRARAHVLFISRQRTGHGHLNVQSRLSARLWEYYSDRTAPCVRTSGRHLEQWQLLWQWPITSCTGRRPESGPQRAGPGVQCQGSSNPCRRRWSRCWWPSPSQRAPRCWPSAKPHGRHAGQLSHMSERHPHRRDCQMPTCQSSGRSCSGRSWRPTGWPARSTSENA